MVRRRRKAATDRDIVAGGSRRVGALGAAAKSGGEVVGVEVRSSASWSRSREDSGKKNGDAMVDLGFRLFKRWAGNKLGQGPKPGRNGKNPDRMGKTRTK